MAPTRQSSRSTYLTMRHQTDSLESRARYRNRALQSPSGCNFTLFCITTIARLSQEEQTRITRDVHTRQRLNNNRSASAPPGFHKPPTRHSFIYPNTPNNSKHCLSIEIIPDVIFHLPFTSLTARWDTQQTRFFFRSTRYVFGLQHLRPPRAILSANASNQHRSLPCPHPPPPPKQTTSPAMSCPYLLM